jgi:hypothetical protein
MISYADADIYRAPPSTMLRAGKDSSKAHKIDMKQFASQEQISPRSINTMSIR